MVGTRRASLGSMLTAPAPLLVLPPERLPSRTDHLLTDAVAREACCCKCFRVPFPPPKHHYCHRCFLFYQIITEYISTQPINSIFFLTFFYFTDISENNLFIIMMHIPDSSSLMIGHYIILFPIIART